MNLFAFRRLVSCNRLSFLRKTVFSNDGDMRALIRTRLLMPKIQFYSSAAQQLPAPASPATGEEYITIYKFPKIVLVRSVSRAKIYQTGMVVTLVPLFSCLHQANYVGDSVMATLLGLACFSLGSLYVMSNYWFRRAVGFIYLSTDHKSVKIAHLTFWGNRKDVVVPFEDIVPLIDDKQFDDTDHYVSLRRHSTRDVLYLTLRHGLILEPKLFSKVFRYHPDGADKEFAEEIFRDLGKSEKIEKE